MITNLMYHFQLEEMSVVEQLTRLTGIIDDLNANLSEMIVSFSVGLIVIRFSLGFWCVSHKITD